MSVKKKFIGYCHRVYEKGFVSAFDGNLSQRLNDNSIIITPSAIPKCELKEKDLLTIDIEGSLLHGQGKLSTENKLHTYIYNKRKDVNAVIHCHPLYTSVLSILKKKINFAIFPEVVLTLGRIPICKYSTPSTKEVTSSLEPFIEYSSVFILQNHGAVTLGNDLREAYYKMEKLESFAKILVNALQIGKINYLTKSNLNKLYSISEQTYNIKLHPKNKFT